MGNQLSLLKMVLLSFHYLVLMFHCFIYSIDSDNSALCYIDGKLSDLDNTLENNNNVHFIKSPNKDDAMFSRDKETRDYFKTFWHSSTHLLAYALEQYYGDKIKLIHGPPGDGIPYCFFYEVALSVMNCSQK